MGVATFPAVTGKSRYVVTLLSGTSWTVPANCLYVNAKLFGGGIGAASSAGGASDGGQVVETTVITTPGASITYAIGAGGINPAGTGGSTTFTGATSALGGSISPSPAGESANNGAGPGSGAVGGQGKIVLEYWA